MKPQQPDYRFPTLNHAQVWREMTDACDGHAAGIVNRVAAAVLVSVPHLDPVAVLDRLWSAVDGLVIYTSCPKTALPWLHTRAMMAGLALVAEHDEPPPPAQAMAA